MVGRVLRKLIEFAFASLFAVMTFEKGLKSSSLLEESKIDFLGGLNLFAATELDAFEVSFSCIWRCSAEWIAGLLDD